MIKKGMKQCMRCREIKEAECFRVGQAYWAEWCMKCIATPSGQIPKASSEIPTTNYKVNKK